MQPRINVYRIGQHTFRPSSLCPIYLGLHAAMMRAAAMWPRAASPYVPAVYECRSQGEPVWIVGNETRQPATPLACASCGGLASAVNVYLIPLADGTGRHVCTHCRA